MAKFSTEVLLTKVTGSFGTKVNSSDAANLVATLLSDAQNKCETMWRNQRRNGKKNVGVGHRTQHCCLDAVRRDCNSVFPSCRWVGFPRLARHRWPWQRLSDADDSVLWHTTSKPPDHFGGRLLRAARAVQEAAIAAVPTVQCTQWVWVDAASNHRITRSNHI